MGHSRERVWDWTFPWRRNRFVWEIKMGDKFMQLLEGNTPKRDNLDKRMWKAEADGIFFVRFAYF